MIFNERDQLEELELLTIFDMYQSSHDKADDSSPKVKEKKYHCAIMEIDNKKLLMIYDVAKQDTESTSLMSSINLFLKGVGSLKLQDMSVSEFLSEPLKDSVKILLSDEVKPMSADVFQLASLKKMCTNAELKKELWKTIKGSLNL
ncbi:MAG: hypothetical protein EBW04_01295 [Betaproteobacteria bacterium]|nr:hypothetical protein [Betaproteobacteria bacterium]